MSWWLMRGSRGGCLKEGVFRRRGEDDVGWGVWRERIRG